MTAVTLQQLVLAAIAALAAFFGIRVAFGERFGLLFPIFVFFLALSGSSIYSAVTGKSVDELFVEIIGVPLAQLLGLETYSSTDSNPDASHISVLAFESFSHGERHVRDNIWFRGGRILLQKSEVGDYGFCRLFTHHNREIDDTTYFFDTILSKDSTEYNMHPNDVDAMVDSFLKYGYQTHLYPNEIFDTQKSGTYWRKISFISGAEDKEICFSVICGDSSTRDKCFPL
jgi:hypothetical protein